jgi:hypothetical protein
MFPVGVVVVADEHGDGRAQGIPVAHTTQKLDLVLLYLLAPAATVTFLPAGEIPVHVPREKPEASGNTVYQGYLRGAVGLPRRRKTEPHKRLRTSKTDNG